MSANRIQPPAGRVTDLLVDEDRATQLKTESKDWPSWDLTDRQICDLELLLNGGLAPLDGYMGRADHHSVCEGLRRADGSLWPVPITLDVPEDLAGRLSAGSALALRDGEGVMLAVLHVEDVWTPDLRAEALQVYGTADESHPGARYLLHESHPCYVGGRIEGLQLPQHHDFRELRMTPAEMRRRFEQVGWSTVLAIHPERPLHRAGATWTRRAMCDLDASLLMLAPVDGVGAGVGAGARDHYAHVQCLQAVQHRFPEGRAALGLLPLRPRGHGPRATLLLAQISKNYGCTHLVIGREPAADARVEALAESQDAPSGRDSGKGARVPARAKGIAAVRELLEQHEAELGMVAVPFRPLAYAEEHGAYYAPEEVPEGATVRSISDHDLREGLARGEGFPEGFTYPEVAQVLERRYPPRHKQGFTVFFTGLSGSGKSTIANLLFVKCQELGGRAVTLLDGDLVRKNLSSELTFSKEHRNINIRRIGYVASEITKNGGIAICAPIAPYARVRRDVREMIEPLGGFILVHVDTPLEVCEARDRKGLYAKARAGLIKEFTGISDPYERPEHPSLRLDTTRRSADQLADDVLQFLRDEGYVADEAREGLED